MARIITVSDMAPRFDRDELLALVPGAAECVDGRDRVDTGRLSRVVDDFLNDYVERMDGFGRWLAESEPGSVDIVGAGEYLQSVLAMPMRVWTLAFGLPMLTGSDTVSAQLGIRMRIAEANARQASVFAGEQLIAHMNRLEQQNPEWEPLLADLRDMAERLSARPVGREIPERLGEEASQARQTLHAMRNYKSSLQNSLGNRHKAAQAAGQIAGFMVASAQRQGYFTPVEQYMAEHGISAEELERLGTAASHFYPFETYLDHIKGKPHASQQRERVSWDDAKRIVIAAYDRLNPEMGAIARRAFDEQWIWVHNRSELSTAVMPGVPVKQGGHPLLRLEFQENMNGLSYLAHEMGHLVAMTLAGQELDASRAMAPIGLHESFSLFSEIIVRQEAARENRALAPLTRWHDMGMFRLNTRTYFEGRAEEELQRRMSTDPARPVIYDSMQRIGERAQYPLNDVENISAFGRMMIDRIPLAAYAYPFGAFNAHYMREAYRQDPAAFGETLADVMRRGNTLTMREAMQALAPHNAPELFSEEWFNRPALSWLSEIARFKANNETAEPDYRWTNDDAQKGFGNYHGMGMAEASADARTFQARVRGQAPRGVEKA